MQQVSHTSGFSELTIYGLTDNLQALQTKTQVISSNYAGVFFFFLNHSFKDEKKDRRKENPPQLI